MAITQNFKVNQLSKDLGIKSKDLMELLAAHGVEAKTQSALEPDEFGLLMNLLTKENQITGIEDYIDGITVIPVKKKKTVKAETSADEVKAAEPSKEEKKPSAEPVKAEPVKAEPVKAEPVKTEPVKTEPAADKKPEVKAEKAPEKIEKTEKTEKKEPAAPAEKKPLPKTEAPKAAPVQSTSAPEKRTEPPANNFKKEEQNNDFDSNVDVSYSFQNFEDNNEK